MFIWPAMRGSLAGVAAAAVTTLAASLHAQPATVWIPGATGAVGEGRVVMARLDERVVRWTLDGARSAMTEVPALLAANFEFGVSADGRVVFGSIVNGDEGFLANGFDPEALVAAVWTEAGGIERLPMLATSAPGPMQEWLIHEASAASADGRFVVGRASTWRDDVGFTIEAFRADRAAGTIMSLGQIGGGGSAALCVSDDGLVIGGYDRDAADNRPRATVWRVSPSDGRVGQFLLFDEFESDAVTACSSDGSILAGGGQGPPAPLVRWRWSGTEYMSKSLGLGAEGTFASSMSADGRVIAGSTGEGGFFGSAIVWTEEGGFQDLGQYLADRDPFWNSRYLSLRGATVSRDGREFTVYHASINFQGVVFLDGLPAAVPPIIVADFGSERVSRCSPFAGFGVVAAGSAPLRFQWRKDGQPVEPGVSQSATGAPYDEFTLDISSSLSVWRPAPGDAGVYDCVVTGPGGITTTRPLSLVYERLGAVDFNSDGFLDPDDLADVIACVFAQPSCERADFDRSGVVDTRDVAMYIGWYFDGCR